MSPTSTTISAHIDFGVPNAGLGTPQAGSHIPAATPRSADLIGTFTAIEFRLRNDEEDQKVSHRLGSFWDESELYKEYDELDILRRSSDCL